LSALAQKASQEALAAIERKDRDAVTEKCKEAERYAASAKEVEEKCKAAYDACKKAREDARAEAEAGAIKLGGKSEE
jgi:predicted nucleotide-binding protein (sugar kinase/HSP70/actin superfamily)